MTKFSLNFGGEFLELQMLDVKDPFEISAHLALHLVDLAQ